MTKKSDHLRIFTMPRRNGRFQQALAVWFKSNRERFAIPVHLKMLKGGCVAILLRGQPACLDITACQHNLSVWASWHGERWDALLDLDVLSVRIPEGIHCGLCEDSPPKVWSGREALWADHLFEEFLHWVNIHYAQSDSIKVHGAAGAITMARLSKPANTTDDDWIGKCVLHRCT